MSRAKILAFHYAHESCLSYIQNERQVLLVVVYGSKELDFGWIDLEYLIYYEHTFKVLTQVNSHSNFWIQLL